MENSRETHRSKRNGMLPPPPKAFLKVTTESRYRYNPYRTSQRTEKRESRWTVFKNLLSYIPLCCK